MRISKSGESLAVILPDAVVEALGAKEGDEVSIIAKTGERKLEIVLLESPQQSSHEEKAAPMEGASREQLVAQLRKFRGLIPADYKFNRDDAYADRG